MNYIFINTALILLLLGQVSCQSSSSLRAPAGETTNEGVSDQEAERLRLEKSTFLKYEGFLTLPKGSNLSADPSKEINLKIPCLANIIFEGTDNRYRIYVGVDQEMQRELAYILRLNLFIAPFGGELPWTALDRKPTLWTSEKDNWNRDHGKEVYDPNTHKYEIVKQTMPKIEPRYYIHGTAIFDPNLETIQTANIEILGGPSNQSIENMALQARLICNPPMIGLRK